MEVTTFSTCRITNILQGSPRVCGKLSSLFFLLLEVSMRFLFVYQAVARSCYQRDKFDIKWMAIAEKQVCFFIPLSLFKDITDI